MAKEKSVAAELKGFSLLGLISDVVLVYLFWTTFTILFPTIWFAPMDNMVITYLFLFFESARSH